MPREKRLEDNYEMMEKLGEGGFGTVYKAKQRTTGQLVAIKILRALDNQSPSAADKNLARFLREIKLCAGLHHPNIVQVIDAGQNETDQLFAVFSFAPGQSLAEILREEGALEPTEAHHLMLQVLDALACAHSEGVIHRDLKPSNIMVIPTGARRNALVLDFGISTIQRGLQSSEYARLTGTAEIVGTPGYAAPEQLRGLEPSPATDLFSWGLVFLECLDGKPLYRGSSVPEILSRQLDDEQVPIPRSLDGHLLGDLLRAVTYKDPAMRPTRASKVLHWLVECDIRDIARNTSAVDVPRAKTHRGRATVPVLETVDYWQAAANRPPVLSGERRQVTALCCQLSQRAAGPAGSPADRVQLRDPMDWDDIEDASERLHELADMCTEVVSRHNGYRVATLGEQILFFFGFPVADEHDAQRAARAALALESAIRTENQQLGPQQPPTSLRVGLHTGLVIVPNTPDATLSIGVTGQIAAETAARARSGGILVTAETKQILHAPFTLEAQEAVDEHRSTRECFRLRGPAVSESRLDNSPADRETSKKTRGQDTSSHHTITPAESPFERGTLPGLSDEPRPRHGPIYKWQQELKAARTTNNARKPRNGRRSHHERERAVKVVALDANLATRGPEGPDPSEE